jgi:hypothetical protein
MRVIDLPGLSRAARWRLYPVEAYDFWETYAPGFARPCRDLLAEDVTPVVRRRLRHALSKIGSARRSRLLVKITGWPRIRYLKEIFPDARFIHIYRDGRAVASSWLTMRWFRGWSGPAQWLWGELDDVQEAKWLRHDRSFIALAAIAWEILMKAFDEARAAIPVGDYLEISYEDLCKNQRETFRRAIDFAGLPWSPPLEHAIRAARLRAANDKWREQLSIAQQRTLEECLDTALKLRGYV